MCCHTGVVVICSIIISRIYIHYISVKCVLKFSTFFHLFLLSPLLPAVSDDDDDAGVTSCLPTTIFLILSFCSDVLFLPSLSRPRACCAFNLMTLVCRTYLHFKVRHCTSAYQHWKIKAFLVLRKITERVNSQFVKWDFSTWLERSLSWFY